MIFVLNFYWFIISTHLYSITLLWSRGISKVHLEPEPEPKPTLTTRTRQWLRRQFWRLLTDFKGTISQKKIIGYVYTPNSNNLKIWKPPYLKNDYADTRFFELLRSNIFAKTKKFAKPFLPVHMGPRTNFFAKKNGQKSRGTVLLSAFRKFIKTTFLVIWDTGRLFAF